MEIIDIKKWEVVLYPNILTYGIPLDIIDIKESGSEVTITMKNPEHEETLDFIESKMYSYIRGKYKFRLAVLEKSEYYPFEDIGFNLDQWIDWLYYQHYSIEEAAKILDENYNELLLIYASKQKGL